MSIQKRSFTGDDGAVHHVLNYEDVDVEYDTIEIRLTPDDNSLMQVVGYKRDEVVYQNSFRQRRLTFDPVSVIGRGESNQLAGTSPADDTSEDGVPEEVEIAFNAIGMAVVPDGEWWLNE